MARPQVKLVSAGMRALLRDPGVRSELTRRAGPVLSAARSNAPVATGEYRDSIRMFNATTDRAVVRVGSSAPHALVVESRTGNLARALDSAGGA